MRVRLIVLIISIVFGAEYTCICNPAIAEESLRSQEILKKENIIRSINLLRVSQKQQPLSFTRTADVPRARTSEATADGFGAIAGTVSGIVEDDLRKVVVVAWTTDSSACSSCVGLTVIESNGEYIIDNLEPGDYYVLAVTEGYIPKFYDNVSSFYEATPVPVHDREVTKGIDFFMEKVSPGMASVSGVVMSEGDGEPIANAHVNFFSPDNPFLNGRAETSEDGSYLITGLKTGKYYASASARGFLIEFFEEAASFEEADLIEVVEPYETSNINFTLTLGGTISGVVINDDGTAIAEALVEAATEILYRDPTTSDSLVIYHHGFAYTDENGEYHIDGLPTGSYFVYAQAWNRWAYTIEWYDNASSPEEATPVPVEVGQETPGIDFQLSLPFAFGEIVGKVTDSQGDPIAAAYVQAQAPFPDPDGRVQMWAYAYTDKDGNYRIENLPNGRYLVSASVQIGWQFVQRWWPDAETPDQAEPVEVNGETDLVPIDFTLPITMGTATISGRVLSNSGLPLAFAFIQVSPEDPSTDAASGAVWAYAYSDSSGYYQVDHLPVGTYFAQAQYWENQSFAQQWYDHAESRTDATPIHLVDGDRRDDINFDLTLRPFYGTIAGTVTDEERGVPVDRAYIEISPVAYDYSESAPISIWSYYAVTNEQGNYQLEWLPEGEYLVSVYADGAFEYFENAVVPEYATPVKVTGGATAAVNFDVAPRNEGTGIISGRVLGEWNDELLEIAVVIARPVVVPLVWPDSERFFNAVTNPDGSYEISGLPAGEYVLFSFAPGYIGEYYDNVFDPEEATLVKVDGIHPTTGIDFKLRPMLILESDLAAGPQSGASLFGKVTDENGDVIRNATIYLLDESEQPISFARTNVGGDYELQNVPPGKYRLKASQMGYQSKYNDNSDRFAEAVPIEITNGRVEVNFTLDSETVTGVQDRPNSTIPESVELYGNYPNPFNPETRISFGLPEEMRVQLRIFNLLGQEIAQLFDGVLGAGVHHLTWDGRNQVGQSMPSGVYFYQLQANGKTVAVNKMTLLK
ncbi:MAG: carboxypeptidase regulatory-like domain-containing protein [bacterium]